MRWKRCGDGHRDAGGLTVVCPTKEAKTCEDVEEELWKIMILNWIHRVISFF